LVVAVAEVVVQVVDLADTYLYLSTTTNRGEYLRRGIYTSTL
jgi:hypothetical protein